MNVSRSPTNSLITEVRWTARISSIVFITIFLLMFMGEGFEPAKITPSE